MDEARQALVAVSVRPSSGSPEYTQWIGQGDFIAYLLASARADELVLYAAVGDSTFIHGAAVPAARLKSPDIEDLLQWSHNPYSSWGVVYGPGRRVSMAPPLEGATSRTMAKGEQLVFARDFDGRIENRRYVEILQKFTHPLGLHFVPERNAYCRFDELGDIEDVVRILDRDDEDDRRNGRIVLCRRSVLDEYLAITGSKWVRMFDSTRVPPGVFGGWQNAKETIDQRPAEGLYYRLAMQAGYASYLRGVQIIAPPINRRDLLTGFSGEKPKRQYETFLAWDWKHGEDHECSSDPEKLGNYHVPSDLAYETSPVFFRPEILNHYKADSDKYKVSDRSITCRHAWHLQSYDINDAGQVHTYLIYLSRLPYEEQRVWKAFNVPRKGSISRRAYMTDFQGSFDLEYDPLNSLKAFLADLGRTGADWWNLRVADLPEKCHYPATTSADEWGREIHALDKLVIEGLETKTLRRRAESLKRKTEKDWKSIKLLEEVLIGLGKTAAEAKALTRPLREVSELRVKLSGHAAGKDARAAKAMALKSHTSYRRHFRALCAEIDQALRTVGEALR